MRTTDRPAQTCAHSEYPVEVSCDQYGYFARVPDLPGCETSGESLLDLFDAVGEAISLWIETAEAAGRPVPAPRGESDYSGRFVVRVGPGIHRDLVRLAAREGMSLNAYVLAVLARETGRSAHVDDTGGR